MGLGLGKINIQKITESSVRSIINNVATPAFVRQTASVTSGVAGTLSFIGMTNSGVAVSAVEASHAMPFPYNATIEQIGVNMLINGVAPAEIVEQQIRNNGASVGAILTINNGDPIGYYSVATNIAVLKGDLVCHGFTNGAASNINLNEVVLVYRRT